MTGYLYLEDGTCFRGEAFGQPGLTMGELVFNTAMTGYQEILTDPSYAGQIVCMTYPLIGNYGIDPAVSESRRAFLKGFVIKELADFPSNYTSAMDLDTFLKRENILALKGIDTRKLTKKIREKASLKALISSDEIGPDQLKSHFSSYTMETNLVQMVSRTAIEEVDGKGPHIAVIDFGIKESILHQLKNRNCRLTIFPYNVNCKEILKVKPDGILLSNGPGDPCDIPEAAKTVRELVLHRPVFGICLGHQILSMAFGARTYKLKYGHHGGNHGVKDLTTGKCYITSQNHEYAVDRDSVKQTDLEITTINLNDGTVEGVRHTKYPAFSIQFHPEASPGPQESASLFDEFISLVKTANQ